MKELNNIAKLLGEKNEQKLKDSITDLLINRFEDDLNDMCCYMIDYDQLFDEIRDEVKATLKSKVAKVYMEKAEAKFTELFEESFGE